MLCALYVLYMESTFGMCGIQLEGALCSDVGESIPGRFSIDTSLLIFFSIVVPVADEIIVDIDELLFNFIYMYVLYIYFFRGRYCTCTLYTHVFITYMYDLFLALRPVFSSTE